MSGLQILGGLILVAVLLGIFGQVIASNGWREGLGIIGWTLGLTTVVVVGAALAAGAPS